MAYDKVIDSAQLEADLTTVADAIRAKGGTTEKLDFPGEYVTAVEAIESGGLDTSDATAEPECVAQGSTFYAQGEKKVGTASLLSNGNLMYGELFQTSSLDIKTRYTMTKPGYVNAGGNVTILVEVSKYGNATASDVVKGKTFTSTAGLKVEGTYEPPVSAGGVSF